ncbi:epimerase [Desulfomarina profundi]|uniref:Epimerase n=1 Tax=Desulfomarina profundi TaxID=2772557 RepID=A0A8D5FSP9_9BACT|nr:GDP-mannose 4,6-dehydratase [Desulfomarina profundi]BCL61014.1 epimerase [Desulfomarina profundi]
MLELPGKNCLVTGGAGFIGSHLVDKLLELGCNVRVLDNLVNGKKRNIEHHFLSSKFEFYHGSVVDPLDVARSMSDVDIVFHLACLGVRHSLQHPFENHKVNAEGTLLVLDAALKADVQRFIHCSSSEVYGSALFVPMPENHPTYPCTVYGAGKLAGEAYARAYFKTYGMTTTVIRPFNTYGPRSHHEGDAGEMIPKSIVRILNNEDVLVFGDGSQTRDFTFVEDTASGLIAAAGSDEMTGKTFNIGSNFEVSIKNIAEKLLEILKESKSTIKYIESRPGDVDRLYADSSNFMSVAKWKPETSFDDGLKMTVDFFRNHTKNPESLLADEVGTNWKTA